MTVTKRRFTRRNGGIAVLAAGTLVASTVATAAAQPPFSDVDPDTRPHGEAIYELAERGIMQGRTDGRFDVGGTLTRAQLASVVVRAAGLPPSDARPFDDVPEFDHTDNIAAAYEAGLVQGYRDGTFRPHAHITRDQVAAVLHRWFSPDAVDGEDRFTDLAGSVHADEINALADLGIALGFDDGTFRPRRDLRRDQAASFVWRTVRHVEGLDQATSQGVTHHTTIDVRGVSSINVMEQGGTEYMVAFGTAMGLRVYDLTDPLDPQEVGAVELDELRLDDDDYDLDADDAEGTFWSAESLNIDKDRQVAFLSRDPRAFQNPQPTGVAGFYVIDLSDVTAPEVVLFHEVPAGHTATCVNDCDYLWSGGPATAAYQPDEWIGRPIFVTDVRDLTNITTFEEPVDTGRYRGATDYAHDVQVDQAGVAWVSGRGGVRGYWTDGIHPDPTNDGLPREATAWDPVPFAGGEVGEYNDPDDPSRMFGAIHNSERPIDGAGDRLLTDSERPRRPGLADGAGGDWATGDLLYVTDENFSAPCSEAGKFYIASIEGAKDGQGWYDEDADPETEPGFALEQVGVWSVADKEGSALDVAPITCSAHYFQLRDGIAAGAWYTQGFRFLDVSDPTDPIQVAYFRPEGGNAFMPMWHDDVIYAGDSVLGIHVLTLDEDAEAAMQTRAEVLAPRLSGAQLTSAQQVTASLQPDEVYGWSCALPAPTES
ncbi:S-layer homology domain-containing protein [Egicoccus sp. AB-alg2]|uniref:S-layer homology domain-containing protein n=1 Tax=Egicoccus sp. AB-alg2 TaxID=3242693 RepID=UPI00359E0828